MRASIQHDAPEYVAKENVTHFHIFLFSSTFGQAVNAQLPADTVYPIQERKNADFILASKLKTPAISYLS